jgi:hypothetical protein
VAVDSTGLEADTASLYFATRRGTHRRQAYPKLSVSVVIGAVVAASAVADWGACNDKMELPQLLTETPRRVRVGQLYADAGYDAEWVHEQCRGAGICSWIPPVKHRADGVVGGHWRAQMAQGLPQHYGRRWAAESFISGLKRVVGARLHALVDRRLPDPVAQVDAAFVAAGISAEVRATWASLEDVFVAATRARPEAPPA